MRGCEYEVDEYLEFLYVLLIIDCIMVRFFKVFDRF